MAIGAIVVGALAAFGVVAASRTADTDGLHAQLDKLASECETLAEDNEELRDELARLNDEMRLVHRQRDAADKSVAQLAETNQELRDKLARGGKDTRSAQTRIETLDRQVQELGRSLSRVEADLRSRLKEMVLQERQGAPRVHVQPRMPVVVERKPYMGFDAQDLLPDVAAHLDLKAKTGVLVTAVREGTPAAAAGLRRNDVVQGLDDADIKSFNDLKKAMEGKKPGQVVAMTVLRGDEKVALRITLGAK
jgi:predicted metalloprotease with PDZ domain